MGGAKVLPITDGNIPFLFVVEPYGASARKYKIRVYYYFFCFYYCYLTIRQLQRKKKNSG
jgi:hypothetical protein